MEGRCSGTLQATDAGSGDSGTSDFHLQLESQEKRAEAHWPMSASPHRRRALGPTNDMEACKRSRADVDNAVGTSFNVMGEIVGRSGQ